MLNKNQSKKRNSWKYYIVIPALVAFVLLFQVEIVAQEKGPGIIEKINPDEVQSIDVFTIDKNTTDVEIDQRVKTLKEKFNISANISALERNSDNKITSINIDLKDEKGVNKAKKSVTTTGIEKIGLIVITEKNGTISFNFADAEPSLINEKTEPKDIIVKIKNTQTSTINNDDKAKSDPKTNEDIVKIVTKSDDKPIIVINGDIASKDIDIKKVLIVIDGKVTNKSADDLDLQNIERIEVLKEPASTIKYGDKGKNGVILITTQK